MRYIGQDYTVSGTTLSSRTKTSKVASGGSRRMSIDCVKGDSRAAVWGDGSHLTLCGFTAWLGITTCSLHNSNGSSCTLNSIRHVLCASQLDESHARTMHNTLF